MKLVNSMRVLVCGGRNYTDYEKLAAVLDELDLNERFTTLIEGGAKGADSLAKNWAVIRDIIVEEYKANWDTYGKSAGWIRNTEMLVKGKPDLVIAFPGGKGTHNMIRQATQAGIKVIIYG